ncbi:MAG: hypothetical protein JWQ65_413 [Devosia sp.]|nr:hypothetical protein [Devosia sp.]
MARTTGLFVHLRLWRWCLARSLRPLGFALLRMWPVTLTALLLLGGLLLPGPASDQVVEAMIGYVRQGTSNEVQWIKFAVTVLSAISLSVVLRRQSVRLVAPPLVPLAYRSWLSGILGLLPLLLLVIVMARLKDDLAPAGDAFLWIAIVLVIAYGVVVMLAYRRVSTGPERLESPRQRLKAAIAVVLPALLLSAFAFSTRDTTLGIPISLIDVAQALGPISLFFLACCFWTMVTAWLVRLARRTRLPMIGGFVGIGVLLIVLNINDNHLIRRSDRFTPSVSLETAFSTWLTSRTDRADFNVYPVILVTAEGGGIRAAMFTASVLARLVDKCPLLAHHIFAVSGVSGGSVGAAVYAAAMTAQPPDVTSRRCDMNYTTTTTYQDAVTAVLSDDHLSPLLMRYLFTEIFQQFWPVPVPGFDRQLGLEWSLERSFHREFGQDVLSEPLYEIVPTKSAPAVPYLLLNTTRVRDGRRVSMSPIFFQSSQAHGGVDDWHAVDYLNGPPLSAAAGTSARFPFISPPGSFTSLDVKAEGGTWVQNPDYKGIKDQYVDGGYFDNSGVPTLKEIYRDLDAGYRLPEMTASGGPKFSFLVLHIGNEPICDATKASTDEVPCAEPKDAHAVSSILAEAGTAMQTVDRVRQARVEYGLNELEDLTLAMSQYKKPLELSAMTEEEVEGQIEAIYAKRVSEQPSMLDRYFSVQMRDRGVSIPLGWILSQRATADIRTQLDPLDKSTCELDQQTRRNGYAACQIEALTLAFLGQRRMPSEPLAP